MQYLVELFAATPTLAVLAEFGERIEAAVGRACAEGTRIRFLRGIAVPEDETCFFLYEADCVDDVARTTELAGIEFERVVEAGLLEPRPDGRSGSSS